eukprot:15430509-Alexandrium_andersonii.AAC.1
MEEEKAAATTSRCRAEEPTRPRGHLRRFVHGGCSGRQSATKRAYASGAGPCCLQPCQEGGRQGCPLSRVPPLPSEAEPPARPAEASHEPACSWPYSRCPLPSQAAVHTAPCRCK